MNTHTHMTRCLVAVIMLAAIALAGAQDTDRPAMVYLPAQGEDPASCWLSWIGKADRTYFAQHSVDLVHWLFEDDVWSGDGITALAAPGSCSDPAFFMRLRFTDIPTTDPRSTDFDNDGLSSWDELDPEGEYGTDPLDPDTDHDGLLDGLERSFYSTDPLDADSDHDGLSDGEEVNLHFSNPNASDSDGDGLSDDVEVAAHTHLWLADTDGDGWTDAYEMNTASTSPIDIDTDHDGIPDAEDNDPSEPDGTPPASPTGLVVWTALEFEGH